MSSGAYVGRLDHVDELATAVGEPRSPTLVLNYPHLRPSLEPKRLRRQEIWAVAEEARRQLCRGPRPKVELALLSARCTRLQVNGLAFELRWHFDHSIESEDGHPSIGAVEHDPLWPAGATISIDSAVIGEREDLSRSTTAHELGHAIFDSPAWIASAQNTTSKPARRYDLTETPERIAAAEIDWVEWRANEFMGGFLAPRGLLHRHMHKRAAALEIPMVESGRRDALPVVCPRTLPSTSFDAILGFSKLAYWPLLLEIGAKQACLILAML